MDNEKNLIFDTGPLISLTLNNLIWVLKPLKEKFGGDFLITKNVKRELIDKPIKSKKFKLEALQTNRYIKMGVLNVRLDKQLKALTDTLIDTANKCYYANGHAIRILQYAEVECLALAKLLNTAVVIDERTTRKIIENPNELLDLLGRKLHCKVTLDYKMLSKFKTMIGDIKFIRSTELIYAAYKFGFLDVYLTKKTGNEKKELLSALLWALKLRGCAIRQNEINKILKVEFN